MNKLLLTGLLGATVALTGSTVAQERGPVKQKIIVQQQGNAAALLKKATELTARAQKAAAAGKEQQAAEYAAQASKALDAYRKASSKSTRKAEGRAKAAEALAQRKAEMKRHNIEMDRHKADIAQALEGVEGAKVKLRGLMIDEHGKPVEFDSLAEIEGLDLKELRGLADLNGLEGVKIFRLEDNDELHGPLMDRLQRRLHHLDEDQKEELDVLIESLPHSQGKVESRSIIIERNGDQDPVIIMNGKRVDPSELGEHGVWMQALPGRHGEHGLHAEHNMHAEHGDDGEVHVEVRILGADGKQLGHAPMPDMPLHGLHTQRLRMAVPGVGIGGQGHAIMIAPGGDCGGGCCDCDDDCDDEDCVECEVHVLQGGAGEWTEKSGNHFLFAPRAEGQEGARAKAFGLRMRAAEAEHGAPAPRALFVPQPPKAPQPPTPPHADRDDVYFSTPAPRAEVHSDRAEAKQLIEEMRAEMEALRQEIDRLRREMDHDPTVMLHRAHQAEDAAFVSKRDQQVLDALETLRHDAAATAVDFRAVKPEGQPQVASE